MLVIDPETGFHRTASLPTVLRGHENSSTFPVCSMTAWIETIVRLNGAVHCPAVAGLAADARALCEEPLSRAALRGPPSSAAPAVPASRNLRRLSWPVAPVEEGSSSLVSPDADVSRPRWWASLPR